MPTYPDELLRLAEVDPTPIPAGAAVTERANRLCGDRVVVSPEIHDGMVVALRWHSEGCVILKAGAAYLARGISGKSVTDGLAWITQFTDSFKSEAAHLPGAMAAVYKLPARYKCALLPFEACENFLRQRL
jgi:NifU-like protein involved in Fe-S cluster formation